MEKHKGFYQSILRGSTCSVELKYATRKFATGELAVLISLTLQMLSCVILNKEADLG